METQNQLPEWASILKKLQKEGVKAEAETPANEANGKEETT